MDHVEKNLAGLLVDDTLTWGINGKKACFTKAEETDLEITGSGELSEADQKRPFTWRVTGGKLEVILDDKQHLFPLGDGSGYPLESNTGNLLDVLSDEDDPTLADDLRSAGIEEDAIDHISDTAIANPLKADIELLDLYRRAATYGGFLYQGRKFNSDHEVTTLIIGQLVLADMLNLEHVNWIDSAGDEVTFTRDEYTSFVVSLYTHIRTNYSNSLTKSRVLLEKGEHPDLESGWTGAFDVTRITNRTRSLILSLELSIDSLESLMGDEDIGNLEAFAEQLAADSLPIDMNNIASTQ